MLKAKSSSVLKRRDSIRPTRSMLSEEGKDSIVWLMTQDGKTWVRKEPRDEKGRRSYCYNRFLDECKVYAHLQSEDCKEVRPHVPKFIHKGDNYIDIEYINGNTLKDELARADLTSEELEEYRDALSSILDELHQCGISLWDIHSENVMVRAGEPELDLASRLVFIDFGCGLVRDQMSYRVVGDWWGPAVEKDWRRMEMMFDEFSIKIRKK